MLHCPRIKRYVVVTGREPQTEEQQMNQATQTIEDMLRALNKALNAELETAMSTYDEDAIREFQTHLWKFSISASY